MKIIELELSGFRAFPKRRIFDLNADAVIVVGTNGQGKTSLFDGVLWVISGRVARLGNSDSSIISKYSDSGEARGVLTLRLDDGRDMRIVRRFDGGEHQLRVVVGGTEFSGDDAKAQIVRELLARGQNGSDAAELLSTLLGRSVYLQQDRVRQFLESDNDQERFRVVSELVGTGRITELQYQLERAKAAWTRATNVVRAERDELDERRVSIELQVSQLVSSMAFEGLPREEAWRTWWNETRGLGATVTRDVPIATAEASAALDTAVKQLLAIRRANERKQEVAAQVLTEIRQGDEGPTIRLETLRSEVQGAASQLESAKQALAAAERRSAERRQAQVLEREHREELKALAQLALRHLEERCPVCQQSYDLIETRRRLEELARSSAQPADATAEANEVGALAAVLTDVEKSHTDAVSRLRTGERAWREHEVRVHERSRRLQELGLEARPDRDVVPDLVRLIEVTERLIARLKSHEEAGERLALSLAQEAQKARREEMQGGLVTVRRRLSEFEGNVRAREATGDLAAAIVEALREAGSEIVQERLTRIEPVLQRVYARIDPHPTFRVVKFLTRMSRGRGHLATPVEDQLFGVSTDTPEVVLSSSQMNALAVAVFLAFNIALPTVPLRTAILDDPLQSLDDINLLGLIDLLRRVKERRQLLLSTHDSRFGGLLERKLRPVGGEQRTVVIELSDWSREGPEVSHREVRLDPRPLHLATQTAG